MSDKAIKKEFELAYTNMRNNQIITAYNYFLRLAEKLKKEKSARASILYFLAAQCKRADSKDDRGEFIEAAKQYLRLAEELDNYDSKLAFLCAAKCFVRAGNYDDAKKSFANYSKIVLKTFEKERIIFVVEDSTAMALKIKSILEILGYENIHVFNTGNDFVQVFRTVDKLNQNPIVLLDMGLPDMDGETIARKLLNGDPTIPVIIITAHEKSSMLVQKTISNGASAFIQKPFTINELKGALDKVEFEEILLKKEKGHI